MFIRTLRTSLGKITVLICSQFSSGKPFTGQGWKCFYCYILKIQHQGKATCPSDAPTHKNARGSSSALDPPGGNTYCRIDERSRQNANLIDNSWKDLTDSARIWLVAQHPFPKSVHYGGCSLRALRPCHPCRCRCVHDACVQRGNLGYYLYLWKLHFFIFLPFLQQQSQNNQSVLNISLGFSEKQFMHTAVQTVLQKNSASAKL